jgi:hypothetical protein
MKILIITLNKVILFCICNIMCLLLFENIFLLYTCVCVCEYIYIYIYIYIEMFKYMNLEVIVLMIFGS